MTDRHPDRLDRLDRLAREARAHHPELGVESVVVLQDRPVWVVPAQAVVFVAVVTGLASFGWHGPVAVALSAAGAGWCAAMVGAAVTRFDLIGVSRRGAHRFSCTRRGLRLHVGEHAGPLWPGDLVFDRGGRVFDRWRLVERPTRALRVHRALLDMAAAARLGG